MGFIERLANLGDGLLSSLSPDDSAQEAAELALENVRDSIEKEHIEANLDEQEPEAKEEMTEEIARLKDDLKTTQTKLKSLKK